MNRVMPAAAVTQMPSIPMALVIALPVRPQYEPIAPFLSILEARYYP